VLYAQRLILHACATQSGKDRTHESTRGREAMKYE
jgi:hypothetical protein